MTHNDIFRRIRFIFNFNDDTMMSIFKMADATVTREELSDWLKKEDQPTFKELADENLALFLNGLIIKNRGKKDGPKVEAEKVLNNNIIFRKLKIALDFKEENVLEAMTLAGFPIGKHELSAFFRHPDHKNYRKCQSQILRNFLRGLQIKLRPDVVNAKTDAPVDDDPN